MTDKPITHFEMSMAQASIENLWRIAKETSPAQRRLLAFQMIVEGMAELRGIEPDEVRMELLINLLGEKETQMLRDAKPAGTA